MGEPVGGGQGDTPSPCHNGVAAARHLVMQQLTGMDASFLYFETPRAPGHVFGVWTFDPSTAPGGAVSFDQILRHIEGRLHVSRTFRQRLVEVPMGLDHPYWIEDPNFDLEYHVRQIGLAHPGDWHELMVQAGRLHSTPLDRSRPLWEMYVIEGLDSIPNLPEGSFAVMLKTHHAAIDGVTLVEITSALQDTTPEPAPAPPDSWAPEREPETWELLGRAAINLAQRPMRMARMAARITPGAGALRTALRRRSEFELPTTQAPRTRFSGAVSGHRVIESRLFDLETAKRIKARVPGATINDVAIATVGGGLRAYLQEHGELPEESLRVMAPISTRTAEQAGTAGNQVTAMVVDAGTHLADPLERLAHVQHSTSSSKEMTQAVGAGELVEFSEFLPGGLAALAARTAERFHMAARGQPVVNTVVSNVPGSRVPLYFAGARLVQTFGGAAVVDGMGLLHGVTSYCGDLVLSIVSCRDMLPDYHHYADLLEESFAALADA